MIMNNIYIYMCVCVCVCVATLVYNDTVGIDRKSGLTFFNPETAGWSGRFIPSEAAAMDGSRLLLFVISTETRSLSSMALASHYIGLGCNVVLCVQQLGADAVIDGQRLSPAAIKDYNRGRSYLHDMAKREDIPVFEQVPPISHAPSDGI